MEIVAQMTLFDYGVADPPQMWECMDTCARSDIYTDEFPLGKNAAYMD